MLLDVSALAWQARKPLETRLVSPQFRVVGAKRGAAPSGVFRFRPATQHRRTTPTASLPRPLLCRSVVAVSFLPNSTLPAPRRRLGSRIDYS